jgi:hypothetical protein
MSVGIPGYNVSEYYKSVWLAPSRTGSRSIAEILTYYDFKYNGKPVFLYNEHNYTHISPNLQDYQNYTIICSARNPYSRLLSHFQNYGHQFEIKNKINFRKYVENQMWMTNNLHHPVMDKEPDYVIRLEHLKEDLIKIPFISDKLTKKQLDLYLKHGKDIEAWEHFYDEDIKEIIYESFKNHFIFWNYEK